VLVFSATLLCNLITQRENTANDAIDMQKLANVKMYIDKYSQQLIVNVQLNNEKSVWLVLDTGNS